MISKTAERYSYRIDADNFITQVSREWLDFAKANEASDLTADYVLGKPIWHFITGADTQHFYNAIFEKLRGRGSEITIPFRCDSPTVVRQMDLRLRLLDHDGIELEGTLLTATPRAPITILYRYVLRSLDVIPICAICRRLSFDGEWIDLRDALIRRLLQNVAPAPGLKETVCPTCNCITE